MKRLAVYFILFLCFFNTNSFAQRDTIRLLHYNLLNYGDNSNPTNYKNSRLTNLILHIQPDIFTVNEISDDSTLSQNLMTNALGMGWARGTYVNSTSQPQTNMMFWKTDVFELVSQNTISSALRDIIAYKLKYKDTITKPHDTVFLTVIVAHLKASQGGPDSVQRAAETQTIVNYLNNLSKEENILLAGDLNIYTSNEQAYQNLIASNNHKSKLYDPLNKPGDWHNNASFADYHTQSTRTTNLPDGGVPGGMDDRFDFILASRFIMNDSAGIQFKPDSYVTVGQDGQHFNKALNDAPQNTSEPAYVISALYELSDHLPVCADFIIDPGGESVSIDAIEKQLLSVNVLKHQNDVVTTKIVAPNSGNYHITLYDAVGRMLYSNEHTLSTGDNYLNLRTGALPSGILFLNVQDEQQRVSTKVVNY